MSPTPDRSRRNEDRRVAVVLLSCHVPELVVAVEVTLGFGLPAFRHRSHFPQSTVRMAPGRESFSGWSDCRKSATLSRMGYSLLGVIWIVLIGVPLFVGAAKGHLGQGAAWSANSLVLSFLAFAGGVILMGEGPQAIWFSTPTAAVLGAVGIHQINAASQRARASDLAQRRRKRPKEVECDTCAELIKARAKRCRFCGAER